MLQQRVLSWSLVTTLAALLAMCLPSAHQGWAEESVKAEAAKAENQKGVALFDGKTLSGWEGNQEVFRVEDGALVGGTLKAAVKQNEFLATRQEYGNFELRLKFKLLGEKANAGIQIRSQRVPNHHEMIGYQADLGEGYWGALYDESRRNKILAAPPKETVRRALKAGDWNDYRIRCEGPRIQLWINGVQTVDYTELDDEIEQTGLIALQIHGGPPSEAWYKDLVLTELP
jgi:hypothetical protein